MYLTISTGAIQTQGQQDRISGYVFGCTNGDNAGQRQQWMVHVFREIHKIHNTEYRRNTTKDGAMIPIQMQDIIGLCVLSGTGCHSRVEGRWLAAISRAHRDPMVGSQTRSS